MDHLVANEGNWQQVTIGYKKSIPEGMNLSLRMGSALQLCSRMHGKTNLIFLCFSNFKLIILGFYTISLRFREFGEISLCKGED